MQLDRVADIVFNSVVCSEDQPNVVISPDNGLKCTKGHCIPIKGTMMCLEGTEWGPTLFEQWLIQALKHVDAIPANYRDHRGHQGYAIDVPSDLRIMVRRVGRWHFICLGTYRLANGHVEAIERDLPGYLDIGLNRWVRAREYGDYRMFDEAVMADNQTNSDGAST